MTERYITIPIIVYDLPEEDEENLRMIYGEKSVACFQVEAKILSLSVESYYPDVPIHLKFSGDNFIYTTVVMKSGEKFSAALTTAEFEKILDQ